MRKNTVVTPAEEKDIRDLVKVARAIPAEDRKHLIWYARGVRDLAKEVKR